MSELANLVLELFEILDSKEESDSGRVFHPTYISSCRSLHFTKLEQIIPRMKELATKEKLNVQCWR